MERSSTSEAIGFSTVVVMAWRHSSVGHVSLRGERSRPLARSNGAFDRGRQAGRRPIAREPEIAPRGPGSRSLALLGRKRRESRPPFPDDLPWRQGFGIAYLGDGRNLAPDRARQRVARRIHQPVGAVPGGGATRK